jgi:adenine-specific DNA-methyltransferase
MRMQNIKIGSQYSPNNDATIYLGDCRDLLDSIPPNSARLIVTSPPYNIGKAYERKIDIDEYVSQQKDVILRCIKILADDGSICWQTGNYIQKKEVAPLDILLYDIFKSQGLKLRNRIIWYFEHGLHCQKRFSGRYETIMWYTKSDKYVFNLDPIRVPQKYPGKKYFKGPKKGQYSCNPNGKNPGDVWDIPNVKHNHPEKTTHPCQFPVELIERLVLSMTNKGDLVFDPFLGVGTTIVAAIKHGRRGAGADIVEEYINITRERVKLAAKGKLKTRPMYRPKYIPGKNIYITKYPPKNGSIDEYISDDVDAVKETRTAKGVTD